MLVRGKTYMVRPTVPQLWEHSTWRRQKLEFKFYEAKLIAILKTVLKFAINGWIWKCPPHTIEIFDLINNPLNERAIRIAAQNCMKKFAKQGFNKMQDDELRMIVAFLQICGEGRYKSDYSYPMQIAAGVIPTFKDRASIIRILRNTYDFRNTRENRRECVRKWRDEFITEGK